MPRTQESYAGEAARVGEDLRDARLALGITLEDLADRLRIRRPYLVALEEGRVQDLPGAAYAVGFVRSYARALGLDANEMVRRFRDLSGAAVTRKTDLVFPEPVPERGVPAGAVVLLGAVFALGGYVAWYNWSGSGSRSMEAVPPLPPRLEQAAEQGERALMPRAPAQAQAPIPVPDPSSAPPLGSSLGGPGMGAAPPLPAAPLTPPSVAMGPAPARPLPPAAMGGQPGANTSAQAATVPSATVPSATVPAAPAPPPLAAAPATPAPSAAPQAPPPAAAAATPAAPSDGTRIVLRASQESWVHVREPRSGQVLLNRVLRPGESWNVPPQRDGLVLTTGRAEGLDLVVDGQVSQLLSGVIGVRRDIALEPDRLRTAQPLPPLRTAAPASPPAPQ
jgi:cytoskeleton protein RodZ